MFRLSGHGIYHNESIMSVLRRTVAQEAREGAARGPWIGRSPIKSAMPTNTAFPTTPAIFPRVCRTTSKPRMRVQEAFQALLRALNASEDEEFRDRSPVTVL
jgi:hypothetical protein